MKYLLSVLLVIFLENISYSMTGNDFFCNESPMGQTLYFDYVIKSCKDGKDVAIEGVCTQTVRCVYVSEDIKKKAESKFTKNFHDILKDKKGEFVNYLKNDSSIAWLPTTLTCKSTGKRITVAGQAGQATSPVCPSPEDCKGDVYFNMQPAVISETDYNTISDRHNRANIKTFQTNETESNKSESGEAK
ncbi:MAG: hypothetical protein HY072_10245 [Deltaproteobacteria bacterium]|nr:hypothetical protein [Deltaproteobacteria bacterium]